MPPSQPVHLRREFRQSVWDDHLAHHVADLARGWFAEDLGHECDWTSVALVAPAATAELDVVARKAGVGEATLAAIRPHLRPIKPPSPSPAGAD